MLFLCHTWTKWIYYFDCTNVANENCDEFCMKEVFKCRERRMIWWYEVWTKAQAWGCPWLPEKYSRGTSVKAWDAPKHPHLHQQSIRSSFKTLYFFCFICYVLFLERLYFFFSFLFFVLCSIWLDPSIFVLEKTHSILIASNTLVFTHIV